MFKIFKPNRSNKIEREKPSSMPHRSLNFDFRQLQSTKNKYTDRLQPQYLSINSHTSRFLNSQTSRASDRKDVLSSDNFYSLLKNRMTQKTNIYSSQKSLRKADSLIQKYLTKGQKNSLNFMKNSKNTCSKPEIDRLNFTQQIYQPTDRKGSVQSKRLIKSIEKSSTRNLHKKLFEAQQKAQNYLKNSPNLQDSLNSSQEGKSEYCLIVIVLDLGQQQKQISVRYKVKKTKSLVDFLKNYIKQFFAKHPHLEQKDKKQIVSFETVDYNLQLDYYLTLQNAEAIFLNGQTVVLRPVYSVKQPVINLNSFQIIQCIGNGGFSTVYLCRFKENGKFYAMKVISKPFIVKNQKKKIVMNERNIMVELRGKLNIAKLFYAFQAKQYLVFVMQYYEGGQLFNLVKRFRKMDQKTARFYITEILIGLQQIHQLGIVYRDFKPQNIMIDIEGHACIADFGLAKPHISNIDERAYSFCGSPQYMPPQMILKEGHSLPVDFYCLGALLYELVTGLPPFYNTDSQKIYEGTLNQQLTFPDHAIISFQLQDLLIRLLCKDQKYRLGSNYGVQQIFSHPWFKSIKKQDFISKSVKSPVNFKRIEDLRFNIDEMKQDNQKQMKQILKNQKLQDSAKYLKIMNGFYYDYRLTQDQKEQVLENQDIRQFKKRRTHLSIDKTKNNSESIALTNCTRRSQNSLLLGNQCQQLSRQSKDAYLKTQFNSKGFSSQFNPKSFNPFIKENSYFKSKSPQLNSSHKRLLRKLNNFQI